jgi:hypothetical protein
MDIRGQGQAYKRGLVLGLTMAEIVILVLFCLLLALAAVFSVHRERIKLQTERIAALEKAGCHSKKLLGEARAQGQGVPRLF